MKSSVLVYILKTEAKACTDYDHLIDFGCRNFGLKLMPKAAQYTHRRRDATKQFRLVGVGGVYWA